MAVALDVNGTVHQVEATPDMPVLWAIRDLIGLTGTKYGCGIAQCGSCTIHVDGRAERACSITVGDVAGKKITTIEGLDAEGNHPVQKAWRQVNVPQCGFCQAGQIMQAAAFLAGNKNPTDQQIDDAMYGNICRCGCYQRIHEAVRIAATGV